MQEGTGFQGRQVTRGVRKSSASRRDYKEIWDYLDRNATEEIADAMIVQFDSKLQTLCKNPMIGVGRPELRTGLRSIPVGKYLLFYRPIENGIELVRVLHGARDITGIFKQ
jgi:toxin ParE1/3/4